jgi:putative addiction module killer protein
MPTLRETEEFHNWVNGLRDHFAKAKILVGLQRLANGNPGDVKPVGKELANYEYIMGPGIEFIMFSAGKR